MIKDEAIVQSEIIKKHRVRKCAIEWNPDSTQNLIESVRKHENLWNPCHRFYKDRDVHQNSWENVATAVKVPKNEVILKWNTIRSNYRTHLKSVRDTKQRTGFKNKRPSTMFLQMSFLDPVLNFQSINRQSNSKDSNTADSSFTDDKSTYDDDNQSDSDIMDEDRLRCNADLPRLSTQEIKKRRIDVPKPLEDSILKKITDTQMLLSDVIKQLNGDNILTASAPTRSSEQLFGQYISEELVKLDADLSTAAQLEIMKLVSEKKIQQMHRICHD